MHETDFTISDSNWDNNYWVVDSPVPDDTPENREEELYNTQTNKTSSVSTSEGRLKLLLIWGVLL